MEDSSEEWKTLVKELLAKDPIPYEEFFRLQEPWAYKPTKENDKQ